MSHPSKAAKFLLAFLVFLGATAQCWSIIGCPESCCPKTPPVTASVDLPCHKSSDADQHGAKQSKQESKSCCCTLTSSKDAVLTPAPHAVIQHVDLDIDLPSVAVQLPPVAINDSPRQLHFYTGQSPPIVFEDPHFGRAPPVA